MEPTPCGCGEAVCECRTQLVPLGVALGCLPALRCSNELELLRAYEKNFSICLRSPPTEASSSSRPQPGPQLEPQYPQLEASKLQPPTQDKIDEAERAKEDICNACPLVHGRSTACGAYMAEEVTEHIRQPWLALLMATSTAVQTVSKIPFLEALAGARSLGLPDFFGHDFSTSVEEAYKEKKGMVKPDCKV